MAIHHFLEIIIPYIAGALELVGVFIIVLGAIRGIFRFVKNFFNFTEEDIAIEFIRAMSVALEFKLAAEIIKTVIVHSMDEFLMLAAVAALRILITFVLHWELKGEEGHSHPKSH